MCFLICITITFTYDKEHEIILLHRFYKEGFFISFYIETSRYAIEMALAIVIWE